MDRLINEINSHKSLENINELQFSILKHSDIENGAVVDVLTSDTYDGSIPKSNGLFDVKMGSIDKFILCPIDERDYNSCPGYFGKINLVRPVFNFHYLPYVEKILKCICFRCSNILVNKSDPIVLKSLHGLTGHKRFNKILSLSKKVRKCCHNDGCFIVQPLKYQRLSIDKIQDKDLIVKINAVFDKNTFKNPNILNEHNITPEMCYRIFKKITDEDVDFLGLSSKHSRPEWMIIKDLCIPPPSIRPSIRQVNNQRSEDDLTYTLSHIVKQNRQLRQKLLNSNKKDINIYYGLLQYYIATYMDNEIPNVAQIAQRTSNRPLKSLTQRLKSKEGRMRWNIQGKRVDHSARTVISVDPNIDINQWGVPKQIAMNLTYPVVVDKYNIDTLYTYIRNGPNKWPGAKFITKHRVDKYGNKKTIEYSLLNLNLNNNKLEYGDIVHRHLMDGDVCLFNRQPSLHRMSMMAHKIKIMQNKTFRMNITATNPYNADFDGDEMNMHVPQSIICQEELKRISLVSNNIISPSKSKPIMYIVQDTLIGAYLFTKETENTRLNRRDIYNLMMFKKDYNGELPKPDIIEDGKEYWTGNQIYSLILPDITIDTKMIKVNKGKITSGYLDNSTLEDSSVGFIQQIYNAYGTDKCKDFLNDTQNLITKFMTYNSFSIGYGDCLLTEKEEDDMKKLVDAKLKNIDEIFMLSQEGVYKPELDKSLIRSQLESDIKKNLGESSNDIEEYLVKYFKKNPSENNFYRAISSGSKGKSTNLVQILGSVGPQAIWGDRISNGYTDRTLPHYSRMDIGASAKGFISNSFSQGLNPSELYFAAIAGRIGVIDTAIKTADSGYISRKLIKATEDLMVNYDGTVRNSTDVILQFKYFGDNYEPMKLEKINNYFIGYDNKYLEKTYKHNDIDNRDYWSKYITDEALNELMDNKEYVSILNKEYENIINNRDLLRNKYYKHIQFTSDAYLYVPVNLYRLIPIIVGKFNINNNISDLSPLYVIEQVNQLLDDITKFALVKNNNELIVHKINYLSFLNSKKIICEYHLNKLAFDHLIEKIKMKIYSSLINPGEMVGVIASQTLGEQSTQLVLNTFHLAGVSSAAKVITAAMPRLNEIMRMSNNMKAKVMEIYLKEEYNTNKYTINKICNNFVHTQLKDIILYTEIIHDIETETDDKEENEFINIYNEFDKLFDLEDTDSCKSNWILNIVFDKYNINNNNINLATIQEIIRQKGNTNQIKCVFNDDNASKIILRVNLYNVNENALEIIQEIEEDIGEMVLKGINGIDNAYIGEQNHKVVYNLDGSCKSVKDNVIYTIGSNLQEILENDYVDTTKTFTNNIIEIYETLGIEAARNSIILELSLIFDNKPNPKHIELLSDLITYRGILMQIDRHGINRKDDCGVISKASFEEIMNMFVKAAVFGEKDNMKGVSANILAGQVCKCGTNSFDILLSFDDIININEKDDMEFSKLDTINTNSKNIDEIITSEFKDSLQFNKNMIEFKMNLLQKDEFKLNIVKLEHVKINDKTSLNKLNETALSSESENESDDEDSTSYESDYSDDEETDEEEDEGTDEEDEGTDEEDEETDDEDEETEDEETEDEETEDEETEDEETEETEETEDEETEDEETEETEETEDEETDE